MSWALILMAGFVIFWLRWRQKNKRLLNMSKAFPGPRPLPFLGNAPLFVVQPEELASVVGSLVTKYGSALCVWLGPDLNIIISEPDDLKLLLTNSKTSVKGPQYKYMADVIGGGILSGSGPTWRTHRKLALPNYGKRAIESYNSVVNQEINFLLQKFRSNEISEKGHSVNVYKQIVKTTSYIVCQTLMGLSREQTLALPYLQEMIDTTPNVYDGIFDRMTRWYLQIDPVFWLTQHYRTQKRYKKILAAFSNAVIQHRKEALRNSKDESLSTRHYLMESEEDSLKNTALSVIDRFILSQEMDAGELRHETFTIFTSSQEASAKISSSILLMLAYHPECQEKLYEEIRSVLGDDDRWISDEDVKRMPYLEMVFSEVIRMFPIGTMLQRTIKDDITISSGTLPAGCSLLVPVYHLQRDPRFWKNPDAFDPERFTPENIKLRHPNCYLPFGLGPMDCLGRHFGKKIIKMICVRVIREFQVSSMESYKDLKLSIAISASPIDGYNVILNRRK